MGYETIYIDIDHGYLSVLMKTAREGPVRSLDRWMNDQSFKERHIDLETTKDVGVARFLSSLLNERGGYFILVNKKGLHFHYRNRYPDDPAFTIWKPVMEASEAIDPSPTGREKLVNTYDNGIRFQVDEFFRVFVSDTTNQNYVILYTSDHGQTLAEHGQVYTHVMPDKVIVDVPEFLVVGERYDKKGLHSRHSPWHPGFPSEQFRDPPRSDGRTDVFAGSSLRQIDFLFDSRGQQRALLYERLSSWIRRLRGEDDTYTTG